MAASRRGVKENRFQAKLTAMQVEVRNEAKHVFGQKEKAIHKERRKSQAMRRNSEVLVDEINALERDTQKEKLKGILKIGAEQSNHPDNSPLFGAPGGMMRVATARTVPSQEETEVNRGRTSRSVEESTREAAAKRVGEVLQSDLDLHAKDGWVSKALSSPSSEALETDRDTKQQDTAVTSEGSDGESIQSTETEQNRGFRREISPDEPAKRAESAEPITSNLSDEDWSRGRSRSNPTTPVEEDIVPEQRSTRKERPRFQYKRKTSKAEPTNSQPEPVAIVRVSSGSSTESGGKKVTKRRREYKAQRKKSVSYAALPPEQLLAIVSDIRDFLVSIGDGELVQTMTKTGDVRDEDEKVEEVVFALFREFSTSDDDMSSKYAHSMDLEEFLGCMETVGLVPAASSKKDVIQLFRDVNNVSVSDYDKHEMSQFEFLRSLEILSKRIGLKGISDLVLMEPEEDEEDESDDAPFDAVDKGVRASSKGSLSSTGTFLANVRDLSDLDLRNMQELLKIFRQRSADTAPQPELDMETFVEVFLPVLKLESHELQLLFMKIDVNSDGIVTWNEFSSFVLDLHTKEGTAADGDSVFDRSKLEERDAAYHHDESVVCICHVPRLGHLVSACANGFVRTWQQTTGTCVGKPLNRSVKVVPSTSSVQCMAVLCQSSLLAVGSEDAKIRVLDSASLRHELTLDCNGRLPMVMLAYLFPVDNDPNPADKPERAGSVDAALDRKQMNGWVVWGDNCGDLHFVPEEQLVAFRTPQETVPVFQSSLQGLWDIKIFPPNETAGAVVWCTAIAFIPDIGLNGVLAVGGSNGWVAIVSIELKTVFHYYVQHRLAVKTVEWCGRQNNILASAGLDRAIHLWRPVAVRFGKPTLAGNLKGHSSGVQDLVFHDQRDVLFSLDSHSIVLVWDLASRTMVGRLAPLSQNPFDINHKVTRLLVAGPAHPLITATNHPRLWKVKPLDLRDESEKLVPHSAEVVATLYNASFDLLLSVDGAGFVAIWQVTNGAQFFKFVCEEVAEFYGVPEVTAASFDLSERRLVVGWNQGAVQLYNFSNGTLLHNLVTETSSPVVAVVQIQYSRGQDCHRNFVAALEDGVILQWPNKMKTRNALPARKIEVPSWMGAEFVDVPITCFAFGAPHTLVTGRKDGRVLEWDMQTGFLMKNEHGPITLRCSASASVPIHAANFLHKLPHICAAADGEGNVHFLDCDGGQKLGTVHGKRRHVVYSPVYALEIDATDSFMFAGESLGYVQVWDISQMLDAEQCFRPNMCIDVFRWKAHDAAVTHIVHMSKYNLILTSSHEPEGSAGVWSVTGERIGVLGHSRWTVADIDRVVDAVPHPPAKPEAESKDGLASEKAPRGLQLWGSKLSGHMSSFHLAFGGANRTESAASQPSDGVVKGQLELTIRSLSHLPSRDRRSKSDPYCLITISEHKQRRTRVMENQNNARVEEKFLYYVEGLDRSVQVEVWDHDAGGLENHDFIGQVVLRLESLLMQNTAEDGVMLKLMRKDGKSSLKQGSITIAARFIPVVSTLAHKAAPRSVHDHIKLALVGPQLAPVPQLRFLPAPAASQTVTALATARWDSVDFRNLSVYQLQDDTKFSGFSTERLDRKNRNRKDGIDPGGRRAEKLAAAAAAATEPPKGPPIDAHRFGKDSLAGRLERSLDLASSDARFAQASLLGDGAVMPRVQRNEGAKKAEPAGAASIESLRNSDPRKRLGSIDKKKNHNPGGSSGQASGNAVLAPRGGGETNVLTLPRIR